MNARAAERFAARKAARLNSEPNEKGEHAISDALANFIKRRAEDVNLFTATIIEDSKRRREEGMYF